jgi:hypothetical protein
VWSIVVGLWHFDTPASSSAFPFVHSRFIASHFVDLFLLARSLANQLASLFPVSGLGWLRGFSYQRRLARYSNCRLLISQVDAVTVTRISVDVKFKCLFDF